MVIDMDDLFKHEYNIWSRNKPFPRETKFRKVINSYDDLDKLWNGVDDYASIFNLSDIFYERYDTFYLDIDGKSDGTLEAWGKFQYVRDKVKLSRVYFSGIGIAAFVDLNTIIEGKDNYKATMKEWVAQNELEDYIDPATIGDVRRVSKLPLTTSKKSGRTVVRFDINDDMETMLQRSLDRLPYQNDNISKYDVDVVKNEIPQFEMGEVKWKGMYPQCIENSILSVAKSGELEHRARLHMAAFLTMIGREDELWKTLQNANDFNIEISKYQVEYIKERGLKPFACDNLLSDVCPFKNKRECIFYPSITKFMRRFE